MNFFHNDIKKCIKVLQQGGLILYPTDTIWGIGCDATSEAAVSKVYALKQRPDHKALIALVAEERDVLQHVAAADLRVFDYLEQTNKPTTVIYDGAIGLAQNLVSEDGSIAIRITSDAFCKTLIKQFGKPLVSTSANLSGGATPAAFGEISDVIKNGVGYIVQYRQSEVTPATASSVIRWQPDGTPLVIRP